MTQTLEPEHVDDKQSGGSARRGPLGWPRRRQLLTSVAVATALAVAGGGAALVLHQRAVAAEKERVAAVAAEKAAEAAAAAERTRLDVLNRAASNCGVFGDRGVLLGDGGRSLMLDTESISESVSRISEGGDGTGGLNVAGLACVLTALDVPDSVSARIDATRALDGRQEASWDDIEASWSYHPKSGVDMVLTVS